LSKGYIMIKEKYKQLFLCHQIEGIRTINIHNRSASCKERKMIK